ncbi:Hypothetical protein VCSRO2_3625 [Vibrio cholerae]|nr:Hypothetical protein VCSRO2_3625 [Vibrio cholerae]
MNFSDKHNARLRGWQRITPNSTTTTVTTATQWDWKRHALTVPLEAFVMALFQTICLKPTIKIGDPILPAYPSDLNRKE